MTPHPYDQAQKRIEAERNREIDLLQARTTALLRNGHDLHGVVTMDERPEPPTEEPREESQNAGPPFEVLDLSSLSAAPDDPPQWLWEPRIPMGEVTLLAGHGGVGKGLFGLQLAVCAAMGLPMLEQTTRRARVLYFNTEDRPQVIGNRLRTICRKLDVMLDDVGQYLDIISASEHRPELFCETRVAGVRHGSPTGTFAALLEHVRDDGGYGLIVLDNASDAYDADEIARAQVRGFIRELRRLARESHPDCALLLVSHVDKATAKARGNSEAYSGSTAWNNSVRSRLLLEQESPGELKLQHLKSNLGPMANVMRLRLAPGDIIRPVVGGMVSVIEDSGDTKALLRLVHEATSNGTDVRETFTSQGSAATVLCKRKGYPKSLQPKEVYQLLVAAREAGYLRKETRKGAARHTYERVCLTPKGYEFCGLTPPDANAADEPASAP